MCCASNMYRVFVASLLLVTCNVYLAANDEYCNYAHNYNCLSNSEDYGLDESNSKNRNLCAVDVIPRDINFTLMLDQHGVSSSGILRVDFVRPWVDCRFEVALLVNSSIDNEEDCANYQFHKSNSYDNEVHTVEKSICVSESASNITDDNAREMAVSRCLEDIALWYEHVFTGCYALRFKVDAHEYELRGNKFLRTDYRRTEVGEPRFRCNYYAVSDSDSSKEVAMFTMGISILEDSVGLLLKLALISALDKDKEKACTWYSGPPVYTWGINVDRKDSSSNNCSVTSVKLSNGSYTTDTECNFEIHAPKNAGYCVRIRLIDERCHRQTVWNPPPKNKLLSCEWMQSCTRMHRNVSVVEYSSSSGSDQDDEQVSTIGVLLFPIIIVVIVIILMVIGSILFVYRLYLRGSKQRSYANTNVNNLTKASSVNVDNFDAMDIKIQKDSEEDKDENNGIVLLYAKGPPTFMSLMTDFRGMLKRCCHCHVYDWYAANEWNAVARVGGSAWVEALLESGCRIVWIDTPRARFSVLSRFNNNNNNTTWQHRHQGTIGDFRDIVFPLVLDLAKRRVQDPASQYRSHFVVRFEGFEPDNGTDDPFADLSPHARYLIPHHLSHLCSHLSQKRIITEQGMEAEEAQLREELQHLIGKKTNF